MTVATKPIVDHNPAIFRSRDGSWVVCECGWKSGNHASQQQAQMAWSAHLRTMLLARLTPDTAY